MEGCEVDSSATTELKRKRTASAGSPCPQPVGERDLLLGQDDKDQ